MREGVPMVNKPGDPYGWNAQNAAIAANRVAQQKAAEETQRGSIKSCFIDTKRSKIQKYLAVPVLAVIVAASISGCLGFGNSSAPAVPNSAPAAPKAPVAPNPAPVAPDSQGNVTPTSPAEASAFDIMDVKWNYEYNSTDRRLACTKWYTNRAGAMVEARTADSNRLVSDSTIVRYFDSRCQKETYKQVIPGAPSFPPEERLGK